MNIGIVDLEPKIFNTALMQIAAYHKGRGDTVDWWSPLTDRQFDHVYCSSLFDYTDKSEVPKRAICGGTGFDITSQLSKDIEACDLDYSIYPKCKTSYVWFSRGCRYNCPFCVVREKEGRRHEVRPKRINPDGDYITIMDNDFNPTDKSLLWLFDKCQKVDIQGVNVRTLTQRKLKKLRVLKRCSQIKIAWDNPRENLTLILKEIVQIIPARNWMCYVLIGYWSTPEEDLYRVETLRELRIDPFAMPYDKKDLYQRTFSRWANKKELFYGVKWEDYKAGKL